MVLKTLSKILESLKQWKYVYMLIAGSGQRKETLRKLLMCDERYVRHIRATTVIHRGVIR